MRLEGVVPEKADESVESFCRRVHPRLVASLAFYCGDMEMAEDVAQEALVRAWNSWSSLRSLQSAEAWVFRVAFNLATSGARRRKVERRALELSLVPAPEPGLDRADVFAIRVAVLTLPPRERTAVILRFFIDLSVDATAKVMGCRPGTVKSLTSHAMDHLRSRMSESLVEVKVGDGD